MERAKDRNDFPESVVYLTLPSLYHQIRSEGDYNRCIKILMFSVYYTKEF